MSLLSFSMDFARRRKHNRFERQVENQLASLMQVARGLVGQQADAEDLVHDTCVKALGTYESASFTDESDIGAWLRQILINTFRDQYRRAHRSPLRSPLYHATSNDFNIIELVANTELSPMQCIENRNSSSAIQSAFSMLPPEVRVVSVLFLVGDFSYKEIASITGCPIGTVMSRLSRGRKQLRQQLAGYDPRGELSVSSESRSEKAWPVTNSL